MEADWPSTAEGFRRYLLTHGRTGDTADTYVMHLRPFWNFRLCCSGDPKKIGREAVEDYLFDQISSVSSATAHVRLAALKAYLRWRLRLSDKAEPALTNGLAVKKEKRQPRPPISQDDGLKLMASCRNTQERLLFAIGFGCGLRISEIVGVKAEDFFDDRLLVKGKGRKERWVAPPPEVLQMVALHGVTRGPIFPYDRRQARRVMDRVARNAKVQGFYAHRMRTTFISRFLAQTHDLHSAQILAGHADPATTARYADFDAQAIALAQMRTLRTA